MRMWQWVLASLSLVAVTACKTTSQNFAAAKTVPSSDDDARYFVGCRLSAGECFNSCVDHRADPTTDHSLCPEHDASGPIACFCKAGKDSGGPVVLPSTATHDFGGCSPRAEECQSNCQARPYQALEGTALCPSASIADEFACFCKK